MNMECSGQRNFLGLSDDLSSRDEYGTGSRMGPKAMIDASVNIEIYDHDLDMEPAHAGVFTHPELPVSVGDPVHMLERIDLAVEDVVSRGKFPVVFGGEHTVSLGAVRALARHEKFTVVSLDAHADLRDTYQDSPYSHACYLRRAMESAECCVLGVRSISKEEMDFAREVDFPIVFADRIAREDAIDFDFLPDKIYLSVDIDVLDPSVMPSTGTPEPGGLSWYQATALLESLIAGRTLVGFDLVELCPQPGNHGPDFTAAKLVYRLMGLVLKSLS